ncbi:hypothetical protein EON77_07935 [bacterium]|nr:MAG: hypothetical protein EON77_07935 [bacterium]
MPVETVPELGYPTCADAGAPSEGQARVLAAVTMQGSKDSMAEADARERFELTARDCLLVATTRQAWKHGATDVEVVFDENLVPLRAWRRMTTFRASAHAASNGADAHVASVEPAADVRRYELRTPEVTIKKRSASGDVVFESLRGAHPTAVIGPGRGLLTAWIKRSRLAVGEKVREPVLDFREIVEIVRDVTLKREADRDDAALGRTVRVYTIYGREAVFTDENDVVLGDLAGMRVAAPDEGAEPALVGPPETVDTP